MLVKEKLQEYKFSNAEKEVVKFMIEKKLSIKNMTIKEISEKTYVAPSTLVRMAHKLDYKGWNELKDAFIQEEEYLQSHFSEINANIPFNQEDDIITISSKIAQLKQEAIKDTLSLLNYDDLQKVQILLNKADVIHIFAVSDNSAASMTFQYYMLRIGKKVLIHQAFNEFLVEAHMIRNTDCVIVISYTGETQFLLDPLNILKQNDVPIIAITSIGENTLSREANVTLRMSTREKMMSKIATFVNDTSIELILDILYSCVFAKGYDKNYAYKINVTKKIEKTRYSSNKLIYEEIE